MEKNKKISQYSILGFQIYSRIRISSNRFTFPINTFPYQDLDLGIILKYYKKNKYPLFIYKEKWDTLFFNLICFELFNLLSSNNITLTHYIDKKYILHPFFNFKTHGYIFQIENDIILKSKISNYLVKSIYKNLIYKNKKRYLNRIVSDVLNQHLTINKEYKSPSKEFIDRYIKTKINLSDNFKITPIKKSYFHELYFEFNIDSKLNQQLNKDFNEVGNKLLYFKKTNLEFREFLIKLESIINQEISNREPDRSVD